MLENKQACEVILDKTIFHPQGGGQPDDEGIISSDGVVFKVEQLKIRGKSILHIGKFENPDQIFAENQDVNLKINEDLRRKFARLHSAGHLIDVAIARLGYSELEPGKGYHFAKGSYVEYIGSVDADKREKFRDDVNSTLKQLIEEIKEEDSVVSKIMTKEEVKECLGEVPSYLKDDNVRFVKLWEEDKGCPCGGTHVKHIKDIVGIEIGKVKKTKNNMRVSYSVVG